MRALPLGFGFSNSKENIMLFGNYIKVQCTPILYDVKRGILHAAVRAVCTIEFATLPIRTSL